MRLKNWKIENKNIRRDKKKLKRKYHRKTTRKLYKSNSGSTLETKTKERYDLECEEARPQKIQLITKDEQDGSIYKLTKTWADAIYMGKKESIDRKTITRNRRDTRKHNIKNPPKGVNKSEPTKSRVKKTPKRSSKSWNTRNSGNMERVLRGFIEYRKKLKKTEKFNPTKWRKDKKYRKKEFIELF